jgi:hypothetical protein
MRLVWEGISTNRIAQRMEESFSYKLVSGAGLWISWRGIPCPSPPASAPGQWKQPAQHAVADLPDPGDPILTEHLVSGHDKRAQCGNRQMRYVAGFYAYATPRSRGRQLERTARVGGRRAYPSGAKAP